MSPGGEPKPSPVCEPTMTRFSKIAAGRLAGAAQFGAGVPERMSTVPLVPNVVISRAGARVDLAEAVSAGHHQAPIGAIGALPVADAAIEGLFRRAPDLLAGGGVERHQAALGAADVHHVVDDQRIEAEADGLVFDRIEPGLLEGRDVAAIDLRRAPNTASNPASRRSRSRRCRAPGRGRRRARPSGEPDDGGGGDGQGDALVDPSGDAPEFHLHRSLHLLPLSAGIIAPRSRGAARRRSLTSRRSGC